MTESSQMGLFTRLAFRLATRSLLRHRRRTVITLVSITFGIASSLALAALARGMSTELRKNGLFRMLGHIQVHQASFLDDPLIEKSFALSPDQRKQLTSDSRIEHWASRVRLPTVLASERESIGVSLIGIDPEQERGLSIAGNIDRQRLPSPEADGIILGKKALALLRTDVGKRIVVMLQGPDNRIVERGFSITGVFESELESTERAFAFTGITTMQHMLGMEEKVTEVSLSVRNGEELQAVQRSVENIFPGLEVKNWRQLEPMLDALGQIQDGFLALWFAIVLGTVSFGLINTLLMSILERTREMSLMLALGARPRFIMLQVTIESACILVASIVGGGGLAAVAIRAMGVGIDLSAFAAGTQTFGVSRIVFPVVNPHDVFMVLSLTVSMGFIGSLYPAFVASRASAKIAP